MLIAGEAGRRESRAERAPRPPRSIASKMPPGASATLRLRLTDVESGDARIREAPSAQAFEDTFAARIAEADEFYAQRTSRRSCRRTAPRAAPGFRGPAVVQAVLPLRCDASGSKATRLSRRLRRSARRAATTNGRTCTTPTCSRCRTSGNIRGMRRGTWRFIAWPWRSIDPDFAKDQLILLLREWYMHPNGQLPAYEWAFGDVNPPVHAWAAWRVYKIEKRIRGRADRTFLERVFHKLLINFTWWVNRKDPDGLNVFRGRLSGPGQYRRIRSFGAAADRRPSRAVRRHELDGHVLPEYAGHRAGTFPRGSRLRGRRQQVLSSISSTSRRP